MPLDHFVTLGRSGLRVSPFCLGAMTIGEAWGIGSPRDEAFGVLDAYLARGGNFIDTANIQRDRLRPVASQSRRRRGSLVAATYAGPPWPRRAPVSRAAIGWPG